MTPSLPAWFAADQFFAAPDGWYVGTADGFRVGPFANEEQAAGHSRELSAKLLRCRDTTEMVRTVRWFVHEQTRRHGRQVKNGVPAPTGDSGEPQARAGEKPRLRFRTERLFAVADGWYFTTREGIDVGPYRSRDEAQAGAARLLALLRHLPPGPTSRMAIERFRDRLADG
jgi:hypothetical protein